MFKRLAFVCALVLCALHAAPAGAEPDGEVRTIEDATIGYVRLGYGALIAPGATAAPGVTLLGLRREADDWGIDISAFSFLVPGVEAAGASSDATLLKLQGLRFLAPASAQSAFVGGGIGIGGSSLVGPTGREARSGTGLSANFTAGVEAGRFSSVRVFVQAEASLPFYELASHTPSGGGVYAPTLSLWFGVGWRRGGHAGP